MDNKPDTEQQRDPWILSRSGVLIMLFLVLGPFGLGLLRRSKHFSRGAKIFLTIAVLTYTAAIMAICAALMMYIYRSISQLLSTF